MHRLGLVPRLPYVGLHDMDFVVVIFIVAPCTYPNAVIQYADIRLTRASIVSLTSAMI